MLIRSADLVDLATGTSHLCDVRIVDGSIANVGQLEPQEDEPVLAARGGTLLPGLHDHHMHLLSFAAALQSLRCGPPDITDASALETALRSHAGQGWLRGVGYHERVAGDIDRAWLDRCIPSRPVRIQHRSGRLWILNSAALDLLQAERSSAEQRLPADGRVYDQDLLMGQRLGRQLPDVAAASQRLAQFGVTGLTDMTPVNDGDTLALMSQLQSDGDLLQKVYLAGSPELPFPSRTRWLSTGPTKFHLHDSQLPAFDTFCTDLRASHAQNRPIAVHCVTETELVFTLAGLREAGTLPGDRIEHASVTPPALLEQLQELGLMVVTQPNFVSERGDAYLDELPEADHASLYRCASLLRAGLRLAAGTDAPFGEADPWAAMSAAVSRITPDHRRLGPDECLSPEQAVSLFTGAAEDPAAARAVEPGAPADLCLLTAAWSDTRKDLESATVAATLRDGEIIWRR